MTPDNKSEAPEWEDKAVLFYSSSGHPVTYGLRLEDVRTLLLSHEEKVRRDWLRSEIDKLEGMKKYELGPNARIAPDEKYWNQALTSIITRYKEELKVLTGE